MLINYNCADTPVDDNPSAGKMEEETHTEGDKECYRQLERRLEARVVAMQLEIDESKREREEHISDLLECISLRDEQHTTAFQQTKETVQLKR